MNLGGCGLVLDGLAGLDRAGVMGAGQCGNDRPGFGVHSITQKSSAYNIIRVLNIIKLNYNIILL